VQAGLSFFSNDLCQNHYLTRQDRASDSQRGKDQTFTILNGGRPDFELFGLSRSDNAYLQGIARQTEQFKICHSLARVEERIWYFVVREGIGSMPTW
jgi:hypothetical protein